MHQAVVYSPEPRLQLKEDTGLETLAPLIIELASSFGSCFGLDSNHGGRRFSRSSLRSSLSRSRSLMSIARGLSLIKGTEDETQLLQRRPQTYTRSNVDLSKKELEESGTELREFKSNLKKKSSTHHGATQTAKEIVESLQNFYVKDEIGQVCVPLTTLLEQNNLKDALSKQLDDPRLSSGIVGEYLSKSVVKSEKWPSHVSIEVYSLGKLPDADKIISQIEAPVIYQPDTDTREVFMPPLESRIIRLVLVAGHYWVVTSTTPGSKEARLRYVLGDGHCLWHSIAEGLADAYAHDQAVEESRSGQNPLSFRKSLKKHRHVPANWDEGLAKVISEVLDRREELCRVMPKTVEDCHNLQTYKAAVCNLVSAWKKAGSHLRKLARSRNALAPILIPINEDAEKFIDALRQPQEVSQVSEKMSADERRELEENIRSAQDQEQEQTLIDAITSLMRNFGLSGESENLETSPKQFTLEELSADEYPWRNFWESNTSAWEQMMSQIRSRLKAFTSLS